MTFFLIATPAACFGAMIGLLALGLCRAASESGSPDVDPGARPLCAPGSAEFSKPHDGDREGAPKGRAGRRTGSARPTFDDRPLLRLIDEHRVADELYPRRRDVQAVPRHPRTPYPDGTRDEMCEAIDCLADMLAAPPTPGDAA